MMMLSQTRIVLNKSLAKLVWVGVVLMAGCASAPPKPSDVPVVVPSQPIPEVPTRAPRLGLALGGGAARGFAHVGVIQVLEQNGIRPDLLVGTSAGSMVAAMYASGKSASELEAAALTMEEATLTDWSLPILGRGMLRGEALTRYVRQAVGGKLLENMAIPLGVLATPIAVLAVLLKALFLTLVFRQRRHADTHTHHTNTRQLPEARLHAIPHNAQDLYIRLEKPRPVRGKVISHATYFAGK